MRRIFKAAHTLPPAVRKALVALTSVGTTVAAIQGLSFLTNLIVIRALSAPEFALLTASLAVVGVMSVVADSGLYQAAMTVGGIHHKSEQEKSQVLHRCLRMTFIMAASAGTIILPIWVVMVTRLDAGMVSTVLTGVLLFGGFFVLLGMEIYKAFLLLGGRRTIVQKLEITKNALRLGLLIIALLYAPLAAIVVLCGIVSDFICWHSFRKALHNIIDKPVTCSSMIKSEVDTIFWKTMPSTLFRAISSQLFFFLLTMSGSIANVAGAGAISKFHQLFNFPGSVTAMILNPRMARAEGAAERNRKILKYTILSWGGALATWLTLVLLAGPLLRLFGETYSELVPEMRMFVSASCLMVMAAMLKDLMTCRGWVMPPQMFIAANIAFMALALAVGNASTLLGYTIMTCILHGGALLTAIVWAAYCFIYKRQVELI